MSEVNADRSEMQELKDLSRSDLVKVLRACHDNPEDTRAWNAYRRRNPDWEPDLSAHTSPADLSGLSFSNGIDGIDLSKAILLGADLSRANLPDVNLSQASLAEANLTEAHLMRADLRRADLRSADLSGADLPSASLTAAKLMRANLSEAKLKTADLRGANLDHAVLRGADLWVANFGAATLTCADLHAANLVRANLSGSNLRHANLGEAKLVNADISSADLRDADLCAADLRHSDLSGANTSLIKYERRAMRGKCRGIRVATCYGNALFKRDAEDQDFLDTYENQIEIECDRLNELKKQKIVGHLIVQSKWMLFRMWGWIDYGRSMWGVGWRAFIAALGFALVYYVDWYFGFSMLDYSDSADSALTPLYYSIVTYTTLGFGDVTPGNWFGELFVMLEVVVGYLTLGLLVSVLANKVARRS